MATLLLNYYNSDKKLIMVFRNLFLKMININGNKSIRILYKYIYSFFKNTELYKLLGTEKYANILIKRPLIEKCELNKKAEVFNRNVLKKFNKKTKRCLCLYLCVINNFFCYIKLPKVINILKRVLLFSLKEKRLNNFKIILDRLEKIYFVKLKINSLSLLVKLINLFLTINRILKSIYILR